MKTRHIITSLMMLLAATAARAQITVGGNVYGGGNKGYVAGNTTVTVRAGDIGARDAASEEAAKIPMGRVFGGARQANIGGNTFVHVDLGQASDSIIINQVYGGNDIAGVIGDNPKATRRVPKVLPDTEACGVNSSWNSFVHFSTRTVTVDGKEVEADDVPKIYVGQAYGGSNGDYYYAPKEGTYYNVYLSENDQTLIVSDTTKFVIPDLPKTFLDIHGGTIAHCYGGGNAATVTDSAVICINNPSRVTTSIFAGGKNLLDSLRLEDMDIHKGLAKTESDEFQIGSVFGGNNKATMRIRPTWNLLSGSVHNLYSGGNRGDMAYKNGLLLVIPEESTLKVDNVFGGCRMADVRPQKWDAEHSEYVDVENVSNEDIQLYKFPPNLAARTIIAGGDVNNVYGGNDVRGKVYFGNAVGIQASVRGDVYGGGNGAYPYTDNSDFQYDPTYGDFYYDLETMQMSSTEGMNAIRPDAEQVSIQVRGKPDKPTIIQGSVYVGGNCATLEAEESHKYLPNYPMAELKIGSYAILDKVFLGNNGQDMVSEAILKRYADNSYNSMLLTDASVFEEYMSGVTMSHVPHLTAEYISKGDRMDYEPYTSYIGSLYYGGNRGSMTYAGPIDITPEVPLVIYDKMVAGCNNANIAETELNARYEGGILGSDDERDSYLDDQGNIRDRIVMNLSKIRVQPMRLNATKTGLEWNTVNLNKDGKYVPEIIDWAHRDSVKQGEASKWDLSRRLLGGNIYGGCEQSGHINGNVVINIKDSLHNRRAIFDAFEGEEDGDDNLYERDTYIISKRNSGVILNAQGMDVLGDALNVFGGGKGPDTQIWGSTTVNITKGYTFQVFGGSESGVIGRGTWNDEKGAYDYPDKADPRYSTTVNLNSARQGEKRSPENNSPDIADLEFIYAGSFEGLIMGNTRVNLDNGRLFNAWGGSCNADILGHAETIIGEKGFVYMRDHVYGGNDLGGQIRGIANFADSVRTATLSMVHAADLVDSTGVDKKDGVKDVLQANAYVEYRKGSMKDIFGGCFGDYDYDGEYSFVDAPRMTNAFVHFRPVEHTSNHVDKIFGSGEGCPGYRDGDKMQDRSYVLVDIPDEKEYFANTEVFGGGSNNGLGMRYTYKQTSDGKFNLDKASAIIDLANGQIKAVYGGAYNEGITRRTVVNVPNRSTINIHDIFGGAYGTQILPPCDVYESNINYKDTLENARVTGAIYGGNNEVRRTLYTKINISVPVWSDKSKGYLANVYGAGRGVDTWSEYTEVNLLSGAKVYEAYGGGEMGHVLNAESIEKYMQLYKNKPSPQISTQDPKWNDSKKWTGTIGSSSIKPEYAADWRADWEDAWTIGTYYIPDTVTYDNYIANDSTNLKRIPARAEIGTEAAAQLSGNKFNANVIINKGATVVNYAYGGGWGVDSVAMSGDVYGTTYVALLGGTVEKDVYAAGTSGGVNDIFGAGNFRASANAYIKGGTVRNVYGGGWLGNVGSHSGHINNVGNNAKDIFGQSNVVIGDNGKDDFFDGCPAVKRNVYGGGEGGNIYGTANVYVNNGYIGYRYTKAGTRGAQDDYVPELHDKTAGDSLLLRGGNIFGGGYVANSYVDSTDVRMFGGVVRGSLHGGGEIGPVGRGTMADTATIVGTGGVKYAGATIYKAGKTKVRLYDGWVKRNVFGGGRGYDNWNGNGFTDPDQAARVDMSAKGYVFGQTEVNIFGGEIGSDEGMAQGYGNVFGGGDKGFVHSAYENENHQLCYGHKSGTRYNIGLTSGKEGYNDEGYYYKYEGGEFKKVNNEKILTEDCKVLVEPWCKTTGETTIGGKTFKLGSYVPTDYLNLLGNKNDSKWQDLGKQDVNKEGIIIHNAVFAGGNISEGDTEMSAQTTTVFGNATASIHDVYHRDLVTVGTGRTGGLYGDGNLTLVDGYRELNITNYGTDYYSISPEITLAQYEALPDREGAYYELRYKCAVPCKDKNGKNYAKGATISADEMLTVFEGVKVAKREPVLDGNGHLQYDSNGYPQSNPGTGTVSMLQDDGTPDSLYWTENGVCSRYAGRLMNTIQRADFCGVYGSRMVMQGARDRVVETVDYTNYTINRVREVSLNKKVSLREADASDARSKLHGNYFGIYNTVNYLGALTSDVDFGDGGTTTVKGAVRTTDNDDAEIYKCAADGKDYGTATYYDWKAAYHNDRKRNNGSSYNKVALASGVYLELTTELSKGDSLRGKDWGYITGVVELDLINVQPGLGGGFVYAKNVHGKRQLTNLKHTTLTALNDSAVTRKKYSYLTDDTDKLEWQTSGNFIHSSQTIIDDCYNIGGKYKGTDAVPAHYWFIKGSVYVYDQYISAYTGLPNAFSEVVNIPLTITSGSHGQMKLLDVMPNRYAYYSGVSKEKLGPNDELVLRDVTYKLNDPISYWDYYMLSADEKKLFVDTTYVNCVDIKLDGRDSLIAAGTYVMTEDEYRNFASTDHLYTDAHGDTIRDGNRQVAGTDYVFRLSNNMSHNTGYILTYNVNNPMKWDAWYTKNDDAADKNQTGGSGYTHAPTYRATVSGLFGQQDYRVGNIIPKDIYTTYQTATASAGSAGGTALPDSQAVFVPAFIVTADVLEVKNKTNTDQRFHKGATLPNVDYDETTWGTMIHHTVDTAYIVTNTIQLSETDFIYRGTYMTPGEKADLKTAHSNLAADIEQSIVPAYYCTKAGKYGGDYFVAGQNYRATVAFSGLSKEEREKFEFNYDALDLLIDPTYSRPEGLKFQYDGPGYATAEDAAHNPATYSLPTPIDYTATFKAESQGDYIDYIADDKSKKKAYDGDVLSRTEYERLLNERYYYAPISVKQTKVDNSEDPYVYYVVNKTLILGDTPYAAGQVIDKATYDALGDADTVHVTKLTFSTPGTYYFCREGYKVDSTAVTDINGHTYNKTDSVHAGTVIAQNNYEDLVNDQANFIIHGLSPTETSTLYVTRNSDIRDLTTEKIITVIYQYDYVETDLGGLNITPVSERHVLNIHINFKSGAPTVEDILPPALILPGTNIVINEPFVMPGAYEVTGGGWELFANEVDADSHINGIEYTPKNDPLYLYQDEYLVAYYAKTYLGKTYSNAVPVRVGNYHDLKKVMTDSIHHYYIDHQDIFKKQIEPKIYINDYSKDKTGSTSALDLLKDLYDISTRTNHIPTGVERLNYDRVAGTQNLEFFLRTDIDYSAPSGSAAWTPIGDTQCFAGTFHGDGHTISGIDASLFGNLCGDVYNLGVVGPFTSAGIADSGTGYVENTWVYSNDTTQEKSGTKPVFGSPSRTDNSIQIVNSYYMENDNLSAAKRYTNHTGNYGIPTRKDETAFNNGEVAYNLNGFYLYKRYADANKLTTDYPALSSPGYVESRFADGDFIYADGVIPTEQDVRYNADSLKYFAIWPDDYLFFGQALNYDHVESLSHDSVPTAVKRSGDYIQTDMYGNRVFRAPAYFRNDTMSVAHFNPYAIFAQAVNGKPEKYAYKDMTAIDFTGGKGDVAGGYQKGWQHSDTSDDPAVANNAYELFYPPMLDDGGLTGFRTVDLTKNLLVYTTTNGPDKTASAQTDSVVGSYLVEPAYTETNRTYRTVEYQSPAAIHGHWVSNGIAPRDHLLVDREDFNAPMAYHFSSAKRMWYQRQPDNFVDRKKGWEAVSLPFTAGLVTTNIKGEITHFYSGSEESKNDTHTKAGHEYWLRDLKAGNTMTALGSSSSKDTLLAAFSYPETAGDSVKTVTNTFLWDYYYKGIYGGHSQKDRNTDEYQEYYRKTRKFNGYPRLAKGTPYIIGFPGVTYYEFDLSGQFEAKNTAEKSPDPLRSPQTVTFASYQGTTIGVSDSEMKGVSAKYKNDNYVFMPSYLNMTFAPGTDYYTLSDDGSRYDKVDKSTLAAAFRPYFTTTADEARQTRSIVFTSGPAGIDIPHETHKANDHGTLTMYQGRKCILVESSLRYETEVRIVTLSGVTLTTFTIKPGEVVETRVNSAGVYIVQSTDGEYTKKLAVR